MANHQLGIAPDDLTDDELCRQVEHLHGTRHDVLVDGSEAALHNHTQRQLLLEQEFLRRFPHTGPDPARTRAGRRDGVPHPPPSSHLIALVVDCHHPDLLADFWRQVLDAPHIRNWTDSRGRTYTQLDNATGVPALLFQPVDDPHHDKNRLHLDLAPAAGRTQADEVARLVELGASIRADEPDLPWVVLTDPEGNEFCVLPPRHTD